MPALSPEIANDFIQLAAIEKRALDQIQLQKLIYIAHGLCLASCGHPLTGDRPEAWEFGPVYRRLREILAPYGLDPVTNPIRKHEIYPNLPSQIGMESANSDLDEIERDLVVQAYQDYGHFSASALSAITRRGPTPWREVFADGAGEFREIPNELIRAQFVRLEDGSRHEEPT